MKNNKDNQNTSNSNIDDSNKIKIKNNLNNPKSDNLKLPNGKRILNKKSNILPNSNYKKKNEKNDSYPINNKLIYEKIKRKIISDKNNTIYNNQYDMKLNRTINNPDKSSSNLNKTFNQNLTSNSLRNNLNLNYNNNIVKKSDKKLSRFAAKINNYYNNYNNYTLINSDIKNIANKYSKNMDILKQRSVSIPDNNLNLNFNFTKYIDGARKLSSNRLKKSQIKGSSFHTRLNNTFSNYKNSYSVTERKRTFTLNTNTSKRGTLSLESIMSSFNEMKEKKNKIINIFKNNENIKSREQAFYLLSISPVLRLCEQLIFSRSTKNVKNVITINTVLENHELFLRNKANQLKNEIAVCDKRLKTPFVSSKIAEITLNFITSIDEIEFKTIDILEIDEEEINLFYNYIKLLYLLFGMNFNNNLQGKKLKNAIYDKIEDNGFKYLKDYIYYIYIEKKEENNIVTKIEDINELIKKSPNLLDFHESLKICRFIAFTSYLIKEIINYTNSMKDIYELKIRAKNFYDIVSSKIDKIQNKNMKQKQKQK